MWLITKILNPVSCKFGAPMGRADKGTKPTNPRKKIITKYVKFYDYCYDKGGAYWGTPANLYVEFTRDLSYIHFFRKERNQS